MTSPPLTLGRSSLTTRSAHLLTGLLITAVLSVTGCSGEAGGTDASGDQTGTVTSEEAFRDQARAECLRQKGFDVTVLETGGVETVLPREQFDVYELANDECDKELGFEVRQLRIDELEDVYASYLESAPCLEEEGFILSPIPSVQEFIDGYNSDPWSPWFDLPIDQVPTAVQRCPMPPSIY